MQQEKKDKYLSNHHFPLHLPQKIKNCSDDSLYAASKWYSINFQWVFGIHLIGGGGKESTNLLVVLIIPCQGFGKKFIKNEAYAGISEWMVRDSEIEEDLHIEMEETLDHNNKSYFYW